MTAIDTWAAHAACTGREDIYWTLIDFDAARCADVHEEGRRVPHRIQVLIDEATTLCAACPVQGECAAQREASDELGMWAGEMRHERKRRERAEAALLPPPSSDEIDLPRPARGRQPKHGSDYSYQYHGCRCDKCTAGYHARLAKDRERRRAQGGRRGKVVRLDDWRRNAAAEAAS